MIEYTGHTDNIFALAWSPDGGLVASAGRDKTVRIWQLPIEHLNGLSQGASPTIDGRGLSNKIVSGDTVFVYSGHRDFILSVAWSWDGRWVASGDTGGYVHVWDAHTGVTQFVYKGHVRFVRSVAWAPHSMFIASGGEYGDSTVQVWHAFTGERRTNHTGQYRIFAVSWSPQDGAIASGSFDGLVQVWDAHTGEVRATYNEYKSPIYTTQWSPDGRSIAIGGQQGTIHVWNARTPIPVYRGHQKAVKALSWSPDGGYIASGSDDETVQVWDASTGGHVFTYPKSHAWVRAVSWSPTGEYIAATSDKLVNVYPSPPF